jgi:hypothetical protein
VKETNDNQQRSKPDRESKRRRLLGALIRPRSPHELRMSSVLSHPIPPEDSLEGRMLKLRMENDIAFQIRLRELERSRWNHARAVSWGGSGFQMAKLLRYFHAEYESRITTHGINALPASFNVVEAFLDFTKELIQFQIRDEVEYLLSLDDYFQWYGDQNVLPEASLLEGVLRSGVIYSYDMRTSEDEYRILGESDRRVAGISMIRHGSELTCVMLAGEKPPWMPDEEVEKMISKMRFVPGKEKLGAESHLSVRDRYLDGAPDYAKVILLTRFDLRTRQHDVRYILVDGGIQFIVLTDDIEVYEYLPAEERQSHYEEAEKKLSRYDDLFSATMSLIFLPIFTADLSGEMHDLTVSTEISSRLSEREQAETRSELKYAKLHLQRTVNCLPMRSVVDRQNRELSPPEFEFNSEGYWKPIGPTEIGEDKNGNAVAGRTWVSRHEQWTIKKAENFIVKRSFIPTEGPDPGYVYIQRSAGHAANVYKIGLTRKTVEQRSKQLTSSTSVPLPFDIVASFEVGNCGAVEAETHKRLAWCRINPQREFFRDDLRRLIETLNSVIADICPNKITDV